jgi:hypothetical protein
MSAAEWIERVYRDVPGSLVVNYEPPSGAFVGTNGQCSTHADAAERIAAHDAAGAKGVYLRATTVRRTLGPYERGGAADAYYLPGLWADVDFGTVGHRHDPDRHEGRILPPDEAAARSMVETSGLPAPSLWVHSGGGLYPWWLLDNPVEVTDENRAAIEGVSARWQDTIQASAHRYGYDYGTGVGDLARVLRVPGTVNRKAGLERPCRVVEDTGVVYTYDDLLGVLPAPVQPPMSSAQPVTSATVWDAAGSVFDRFAAENTWGDLLARYGFTRCTGRHGPAVVECFTRPGDPEHSCSAHVLTVNPHVLVVWSESAGLPVGKGQKLTKARVLAHMEHNGDESAAARSLTPTPAATVVGGNTVYTNSVQSAAADVPSNSAPTTLVTGTTDSRVVVFERFPRLDLAVLLSADRKPREWVIDGLIASGASTAVVAPAGNGKSLLLLAASLAVARGDRHFAGLPVSGRRVLLVDMENTEDDLADRFKALGVTDDAVSALDQLVPIHLPPLAPLDTAMGGMELGAILDAYDVQDGDVVVLDSLQRVINGAENDSDTMRAYYRHTGLMLKRRGLTVIRADNTGKDAEKGARGTSGKRDDVDVELILTVDPEKPERLRIRPGKVRFPGVRSVIVNRVTDDDGYLSYSTAGDPFRVLVADALTLLDQLSIPTEAGERKAAETIKGSGHKVSRAALRTAIKERRASDVMTICAPRPYGAPSGATEEIDCADDKRRTPGAPRPETVNLQVNTANGCAAVPVL